MPKENMADEGYSGEILGFNNIEMTQDEAKALDEWLDAQILMAEEANPDMPVLETLRVLAELVITTLELGNAHTEDTKETVNIVLAADYVMSDEGPEEVVDAEEDAVEKAPQSDSEQTEGSPV